jgi:hypothetical protein
MRRYFLPQPQATAVVSHNLPIHSEAPHSFKGSPLPFSLGDHWAAKFWLKYPLANLHSY